MGSIVNSTFVASLTPAEKILFAKSMIIRKRESWVDVTYATLRTISGLPEVYDLKFHMISSGGDHYDASIQITQPMSFEDIIKRECLMLAPRTFDEAIRTVIEDLATYSDIKDYAQFSDESIKKYALDWAIREFRMLLDNFRLSARLTIEDVTMLLNEHYVVKPIIES